MSSLVVLPFVICVVFATSTRCDYDVEQVPSYRKESSTTFLRLTALRDDEGIWIARFGEYEITIELKHRPRSKERNEPEDKWTLKIKHMSKRFKVPEPQQHSSCNNEVVVDGESLLTEGNSDTWQQNNDDTDPEDWAGPTFTKVRPSGKGRKAKSRRQLTTKSFEASRESNATTSVAQPAFQDPPVFKELSQGKHHVEVAFNNDTNQTDESFQEFDDKPWTNVAALILDSIANDSLPDLDQIIRQSNKEEINSTESNFSKELERPMEPYALPLQQPENDDEVDKGKSSSFDNVNEKDIAYEQDYNTETLKLPEGQNTNYYNEMYSRNSKEGIDGFEISNQEQQTGLGSDYVIEDPTVRVYDKVDEDNVDEEENKYDSSEVTGGDFQPTAEMKRILDWFPRSKLLATENNGYKLFPGVGWFKLITWPERWGTARKVCESEMAHMAVPDTKRKVRVFLKIFKNYPDVLEQTILHKQVYVGVHSPGPDRNFSTVLGEPFLPKFPIWFPEEPDNADPGEDCVTFHAEGKLRDVPCFYNLPFLCEKALDVP